MFVLVTSTTQLSTGEMETDLANDDTDYSGDGDSQSHDKPCMLADSCCAERMVSLLIHSFILQEKVVCLAHCLWFCQNMFLVFL